MNDKYPKRIVAFTAMSCIPLVFKIIGLSILNITIPEFYGIFLPIKLLFTVWYVFLGHQAENSFSLFFSFKDDFIALIFLSITIGTL
jgi:hypothetical protein